MAASGNCRLTQEWQRWGRFLTGNFGVASGPSASGREMSRADIGLDNPNCFGTARTEVAEGACSVAVIHETSATLRFWGDELDPHEVTKLLGAAPTRGAFKGQLIVGRGPMVARSGKWHLTVNRRQPGNLSGQIEEILSGLTQDLDVWRDLSNRFDGNVFVGFFMAEGNEGYDLSSKTMKLLTDRGLSLLLDIYSGGNEDDRQVYPLTVICSSVDGGSLTLRRISADRMLVEARNERFWGRTECDISRSIALPPSSPKWPTNGEDGRGRRNGATGKMRCNYPQR